MNGTKQMNKVIKIKTFPRIHITLINMNNTGYRKNGGIGFSITTPPLTSTFEISNNNILLDKRNTRLSSSELERLYQTIDNVISKYKLKRRIKCTIEGEVYPHYGLGSNSSIYLAVIEALFLINNKPYNKAEVVVNSQRGGTSGIGINTYFDGGFVFDVGIKQDSKPLYPSSSSLNISKPLVLYKGILPNWKIGLCIPLFIKNKTEKEEFDFFKKNCSIEESKVNDILYESVYGITSSIIEADYLTFCESIKKIQSTPWKFKEREQYGFELTNLENDIYSFGADCVGMSSFGPLLFFMGKDINSINKKISTKYPNTICYIANLNNNARIITND